MIRSATLIALLSLTSGFLGAQAGGSQSWSGLLVAAGCQASGSAPHGGKATGATGDMARSTPTVSSREQNRTFEQQANQADRSPASTNTRAQAREKMNATDQVKTPPVDSVDTRGSAPLDGPALGSANVGTDPSCRISDQTTAFALRLSDGRLVRFDDASNTRIAKQLQSGGRNKKNKTYRAKVKGTMSGETIGLESLHI